MTTEIPSDLVPFVQRLIAEKRFLSEEDVLAEGLRLLQARETLREEVKRGFDQLDAGQGVPAEMVYARGNARIDALLLEGIESGKTIPLDAVEWNKIRTEVNQRISDRD